MCAPSDNHEKRLIAMFDSFNKTVIRSFSRNLRKKKVNREKRCPEEPIDYILDLLSYEDRYPSDYFVLYADELSCVVYSETLYKALPSCAQVKIPLDAPKKAFVRAWNLVVSKKLQYGAALRRRAENTEDALTCYWAKEMLRFLDEVGKLTAFDYYFSLKALDHMELIPNGKLAVVFLSGVRLTV